MTTPDDTTAAGGTTADAPPDPNAPLAADASLAAADIPAAAAPLAAEQRGAGTGEEAVATRGRSYNDPAFSTISPTPAQQAEIDAQNAQK
jgi:hypothetical protein